MRIDQLAQIVEVSKTKSINRAAHNCFISHQNICHTIQSFEQIYGIKIFHRSSKGAILTSAGETFVRLAQEILDKVHEMEQLQKEFSSEALCGDVRFYQTPNLNLSTQTEFIAQFCQKHPDIKITSAEREIDEIIQVVAETPNTIGFLALPIRSFSESFYQERGIDVRFQLKGKHLICVGTSYPLKQKTVSINQMLKHPWVIFEYSKNLSTETLLEPYGKPEVFARTNNPDLFRKLIRDGLAIGMIVELASHSKHFAGDKFRFIPLRESIDDLGFCFHLILSSRYCPSPATELLIDTFIDRLPKNQPRQDSAIIGKPND